MRWILGLVLVVALTLHNLPYLIRDQAVIWLRGQGVEQAGIRALKIDWLQGRVTLAGVELRRAGELPFLLEQLQVGIDYGALTGQRLYIQGIVLNGLNSGLVEREGQLWLGPLNLTALKGDSAAEETSEEPLAWQFGIDRITLADIDWQASVGGQNHHLRVDRALMQGLYQWNENQATRIELDGVVNDAPLSLQTDLTPLPADKRSELAIKVERFPVHTVTALIEPGLQAFVTADLKIKLDQVGERIALSQTGALSVADLRWERDAQSAAMPLLRWQGDLALALQGDKPADLDLKGQLVLSKAQAAQGAQRAAVDKFSLDTRVRSKDLNSFNVNVAGLNVAGLRLSQPDTALGLESLLLKGVVGLTLPGTNGGLDVKGDLQLRGTELQQKGETPVVISLPETDWQGETRLKLAESGVADLNLSGDLNLRQPKLTQGEQTLDLADLNLALAVSSPDMEAYDIQLPSVQLQALSVQAGETPVAELGQFVLKEGRLQLPLQLSIDSIETRGLGVMGERETLVRLDSTRINQLQLEGSESLQIGQVVLSGSESRIKLSQQGRLPDIDWLTQQLTGVAPEPAATAEGESAAAETEVVTEAGQEPAAEASPMRVQIGGIRLEGSNRILFTDMGTEPAFKTDILIESLEVGALDSAQVVSTPFSMSAKINRFAALDAQGALELTGDDPSGNWTLNLSGLELPPLSPYAERYTGYYLDSGQFHLKAEGNIDKGVVSGSNELSLSRLAVDQRDLSMVQKFSEKITMPLETAIMVLQDNDKNIVLNVPVSGSLADPKFGYQAIIAELATRGVKRAALSFLTKSLQPYATLISLAKTAVEATEKGAFISLNPVVFQPGSAELDRAGKEYVGKLADMLAAREAMRLNICGRSVAADRELLAPELVEANKKRKQPLPDDELEKELQQKLAQLASQRAEQIKAQLTDKVSSDRLFLCFAQYDEKPEAKPRAVLGL